MPMLPVQFRCREVTIVRIRVLLPLLPIIALLVASAPASAARFVATLKAPTHHPRADRAWTITVTCRSRSGRPLRATATYQFLSGGQVVATRYPSPHAPERHTPFPFRGSFRDPVLWPKRSIGVPLTFRVVVAVKGKGKVNLDYAVRVRR